MRRDDWEARLAEVLATTAVQPFAWGVQDCCLFAADCVQALTGHDYAYEFRGTYDDADSAAMRLIAVTGTTEIAIAIDKYFKLPRLGSVAFAARGDLVLFKNHRDQDTLGVVDLTGERIACVSPQGLEYLPIDCAVMAWAV